ncbi:MAG: hypothetical protein ACTSP7_04160 [Candidatus Heimdallarchaeota archaeon]
MIQDFVLAEIMKSCFTTYSSRLIFVLLSGHDFCTRNELINWTGFSSITISRYLQEFGKAGLIEHAPGIVYLSDFGKDIFTSLYDLFDKELEIASDLKKSLKITQMY